MFRGEAEMLVVPGAAGEIGVLARHAPLVATLKAGSTRVYLDRASEDILEFATGPGFFKVELDNAIALVDDAVNVKEIDDARAKEQLEAAKAELEKVEQRRVDCRPLAARAADQARRESANGRRPELARAGRGARGRARQRDGARGRARRARAGAAGPDRLLRRPDVGLAPAGDRGAARAVAGAGALRPRQLGAGAPGAEAARLGRGAVGVRAARRPGARRLRAQHPSSGRRGRRRARPDALLPRLAPQRRGVRDQGDAGRTGRGVHGRRARGVHRHGAHAHAVRPARGGDTAAEPGQRRVTVRARARERVLGDARSGGRAPAHTVRPRRRDRADAGRRHAQVRRRSRS